MEKLCSWFANLDGVLVALSGGVDSSVLASAAFSSLGYRAIAATVKSELQSEADVESAINIASEIGIEHIVLEFNALALDCIRHNSQERCRLCKQSMAEILLQEARSRGINTVVDGTNASDRAEDRPGMKALQEKGLKMPLRELGITKEQVRKMAREINLSNAERPSRSCLATRIVGEINLKRLKRVEYAEKILPQGFRIEDRGDLAVVKVPAGEKLPIEMSLALKRIGYTEVTTKRHKLK